MNAAMLAAMEEWGETVAAALADGLTDAGPDRLVRYWRRVIETVTTHRALWVASIEAMVQSEHNPELRGQLADGIQQGRSGMAALLTGTAEDALDDETVRELGSIQMALMSGVIIQWLADPRSAPSPEQVVAGLRAMAALT
jgi:hypothetical protein